MPHVTSIGLDVHARSVAAAAFNPFTGEVVRRSFGTDASEIAEWALGFEDPRACYESGPTGFHMARELRALGLDCAVAAVSKMQRPAADARRKNDRRDAEFIARMLATHNIVEVPLPDMAVEAARDLDRALDDATRELRRSRQRLNMFLIRLGHVWDERNADGARKKAWTRAHWRWVSEIRLEGPQRDALEYYVTAARCAESDRRQLERRVVALAGDGGGALLHQGNRHPDGLQARSRGGLLHEVPDGPGLRELVRAGPVGALERRDRAARRDNQDGQPARQDGAGGVGVALPDVHAPPEGPGARRGRRRGDPGARRRLHRQALPPPRGAGGGGQELVQGKRRRRARARLLGLGDRAPGGGDPRLTPSDNKPPAGRARASTHRRREFTTFLMGSPGAAPDKRLDSYDSAGRRIEMRWGARTCRADRRKRARKSPRILACQASVD